MGSSGLHRPTGRDPGSWERSRGPPNAPARSERPRLGHAKAPDPAGRGRQAPATGFEPVTVRLTVGCSAVELRRIATREDTSRAAKRLATWRHLAPYAAHHAGGYAPAPPQQARARRYLAKLPRTCKAPDPRASLGAAGPADSPRAERQRPRHRHCGLSVSTPRARATCSIAPASHWANPSCWES